MSGEVQSLTPVKIASYFLYLANKEQKGVSNKALQKLVYYAQAWSLTLRDKALFKEDIEAWVHGPAIRSLYAKYRQFGFSFITSKPTLASLKLSKTSRSFLDEIWRVYGKFDAQYLETLTHNEEPWQSARTGLLSHESSENVITHTSMKEFYLKRLADAKSK